jgi:hypothetical protein
MSPYLFVVVLLGVVGYVGFVMWRQRSALASAGPAFTSFFTKTGYQYPDLPGQPPEAQAQRAMQDGQRGTAYTGYHYVRDFHGMRVDHHASWGSATDENGRPVHRMSNQWDATFPQPLRFGLHIADRRLDSTLQQLASEVLLRKRRIFQPRFPHRVETGVPSIDSRFVVYASDPDHARAVLAGQPALVALLDGWAELDVAVGGQGGSFADPELKNMNAAMGGTIGNMAVGFDYQKRLDLSIPVHDRVAELLGTLGRACV